VSTQENENQMGAFRVLEKFVYPMDPIALATRPSILPSHVPTSSRVTGDQKNGIIHAVNTWRDMPNRYAPER
jgi:hypothetical protein